MPTNRPITDRILGLLHDSPECDFDLFVARYPEFTWNELFQEVGRLSRTGQVSIMRGVGVFTVKLAPVKSTGAIKEVAHREGSGQAGTPPPPPGLP